MSTAGVRRSVRAVGERALLVECADLSEVMTLRAALGADPLPGQLEVLAAARTVLVRTTDRRAREALAAQLAELPVASAALERAPGEELSIPTVYDGADLAEVAELTGMSTDGVVAAHTGQRWSVAFGGFAPGFAYLVGERGDLEVPRRRSPRTEVPAGAVALAGSFSAVYPRSSPGGWQLIGRTDAPVWDLDRSPPALLRPGDTVRFRAVREVVTGAGTVPPRAAAPAVAAHGALHVVTPGGLSLLEDLGRPGLLDLGVSPSGAADRGAARQANRLVGNPREAAVVECVLGGLEVRAEGHQVVAVSGAPAPLTLLLDGEELAHPATDGPVAVPSGHTLRLGVPAVGLRTYLAVRGGVAVPAVLGSRSTDVLSGIGPAPLRAGSRLPVGPPPATSVGLGEPARVTVRAEEAVSVAVVLGPREDWVTPDSLDRFLAQEWTVTDRSNRVGIRLDGAPLRRVSEEELPSEATVAGAVQIPADGRPVVFLADHPVTGGYPVIAVVVDADLDVLAQLRPGERVRFRLTRAA